MSTHTPGPFHLIQYETDEYPTHCKADARIIGADGLCYGILFGGEDSYPDIEKIRMAHAFIVRACNSHAAMLEALRAFCDSVEMEAADMAYTCGLGAGEWEAFIDRTKQFKQYQHAKEALRLAEGRG